MDITVMNFNYFHAGFIIHLANAQWLEGLLTRYFDKTRER